MRAQLALALLALLALVAADCSGSGKKNVLFLIADDLGLEIGAYNNTVAPTPHIDALAAMSTIFDNAYTSVSSCSSSRSVIMTGLPSHTNGMYGLHTEGNALLFESLWMPGPDGQPLSGQSIYSAPLLLGNAGYYTGLVGKKHVGPDPAYPFSYQFADNLQNERNITLMKELVDGFFAKCDDRPFFLYVGFGDPHRCGGTDDNVKLGTFCEIFGDGKGVNNSIPDWTPFYVNKDDVPIPDWCPDIPAAHDDISRQYTSISRLDQGVGLILQALNESGAFDNTMIVFFSDNGPPFPRGKTNLYESGIREPLFIRYPGQTNGGIRNQAFVSELDLVPTLLDFTGVEYPTYALPASLGGGPTWTPVKLPGRSLLPILNETNPSGWNEIFATHTLHQVTNWYPMRAYRNNTMKLIWNLAYQVPFSAAWDLYWAKTYQQVLQYTATNTSFEWIVTLDQYLHRPQWELYDLSQDPLETKNLASLPGYASVLADMQRGMWSWQNATNDPFQSRIPGVGCPYC